MDCRWCGQGQVREHLPATHDALGSRRRDRPGGMEGVVIYRERVMPGVMVGWSDNGVMME